METFLAADVNDESACRVTDIGMPGTSWLVLPTRLREPHQNLPVIFMTAFDTPKTRAEAHAAGAAGYFREPVDDRALLDVIEWSLSRNPLPNER